MFNRDSTNTTSINTLDLIAFLTLPFIGWNQINLPRRILIRVYRSMR